MKVASEYPDVELSHMYVDNAAMQLVRDPKQVKIVQTLLLHETSWHLDEEICPIHIYENQKTYNF